MIYSAHAERSCPGRPVSPRVADPFRPWFDLRHRAHVSIVEGLRRVYGLEKRPVKIHEPYQMLGLIEDDLRTAMGVDTTGVFGRSTLFGFPIVDWKGWRTPWGQDVLVPDGFRTTTADNGDLLIYPEGDLSVPGSGRSPATSREPERSPSGYLISKSPLSASCPKSIRDQHVLAPGRPPSFPVDDRKSEQRGPAEQRSCRPPWPYAGRPLSGQASGRARGFLPVFTPGHRPSASPRQWKHKHGDGGRTKVERDRRLAVRRASRTRSFGMR